MPCHAMPCHVIYHILYHISYHIYHISYLQDDETDKLSRNVATRFVSEVLITVFKFTNRISSLAIGNESSYVGQQLCDS